MTSITESKHENYKPHDISSSICLLQFHHQTRNPIIPSRRRVQILWSQHLLARSRWKQSGCSWRSDTLLLSSIHVQVRVLHNVLHNEDSSLFYQTILTFSRIKDVLTSAVSMGATVVRSHTLGKYCQAWVLNLQWR